jgi:hypothetical protein
MNGGSNFRGNVPNLERTPLTPEALPRAAAALLLKCGDFFRAEA